MKVVFFLLCGIVGFAMGKQSDFLGQGALFSQDKNKDLYWEALVQAAHEDESQAKAIVQAIRNNKSIDTKGFFLWKEAHPVNIDHFFDRLFLCSVAQSPELLTNLGLFDQIGIHEQNRYLDDLSPKGIKQQYMLFASNLDSLKKYPAKGISYDVFLWMLEDARKGEPFIFYSYPVNQLFGVIQNLTALFMSFQPLGTEVQAEDYVARLEKIPKHLSEVIETVEYQKKEKIMPPRFAIEKTRNIIDQFTQIPVDDHPFVHRVMNTKMVEQAKKAVKDKVNPSYHALNDYLGKLLEVATTNDGVWALPKGDAYYDYILHYHTTADWTAEEIHLMGLAEVKKIQEEMKGLFIQEGLYDPNKTVGELMRNLAQDSQFYYPNTEEGRNACIQEFEAILARSKKELWPLFGLHPDHAVEIKPVPPEEAEGAPAAYYMPPSLDGSRPGVFYVNLSDMNNVPKFRMETLAVHEAEPGHHFQLTIQSHLPIPILRKMSNFTAYVEGWALYVEKLAYEQGFYSSSFQKLGHLQDELLRAVRLVVDTGIHRKRWSREKALEYMMNETGYKAETAIPEIERYFVLPGQACAYKVGQMKILELRAKERKRLQDAFELKTFHDKVLKEGALPLHILEKQFSH